MSKKMLTPEEKKSIRDHLAKICDNSAKMLVALDHEEWERFVDTGYEMDDEMDVVYNHMTKIMVDMGLGI